MDADEHPPTVDRERAGMTSNETNSATNPGRVRITLAAIAAMSVIAVILMGVMTAQAQSGAVPNLELSSTSPGGLTITWDAPDPAPSDYRVIWAKQDLDFPSYKAANEASRGNEYPGGTETSITLTGLAGGETFKARMRARYTSGGQNNGSWSGPWTDTVTTRVKDDPPAAPTGLTADASYDSMTLNWTAPTQGTVTGYRVFRGTDADSLSSIIQDTGNTSTEYTDSTVAAETTYHYAVLALSQDGDGAQSAAVRATTPAEPQPAPAAPTGITAAPSHDRVTLSWNEPQDSSITGYQIWRGADAASLSSIKANTGNALVSYVDNTVTAETVYHYAVSAINQTGTSDRSGTVSTTTPAAPQPPAAPTGLTTSGVTHNSIILSWTAPEDTSITGYRVLRGTEAGNLTAIAQDTGKATVEYTDSTVAAETTYHYAVLALSQDGDGARSTAVSATTTATPQPIPSAPTGLTTYQVAHDSVTISWTTPSQGSVTGYRILRGTDSNSLSAIVQNTDSTATEYTDSTVTAATTYYYAVLALSAEGDGAQSAAVSATTPAAPQQATVPDLRLSSTAAGQLTISWDKPQPTPSDYRIIWAKQGLDFPSYTAANEANRGNEYPSGDETSITLTGLNGGSTFNVKARTRYTSGGDNNGAWSGPWSDTVTARVKDDLPTAPTGLTASRVAHDSVTLNWTAPTQGTVTGYRIFRGTDADSLAAIVQDTGNTSTEYTDSTVAAGTTYHYAVLALSQDGDGAQSATVNATTPAEPRSKKDNPKGTPDTDRLQRGAGDATGKPTISAPNLFRVPAVLFASKGSIADTDGLPTEDSKFTWQWVRVDGSTETDIAGAAGKAYRLTVADVGKKIKVKVSFTDAAVNSEGPLKSDATATITAASSCNSPSQVRRASRYVNTGTLTVGKSGSDYGFSPSAARSAFDNGHFWAERGVFTAHSMMVITGGHLRLETTFELEDPIRNYFTLYVCGQQFHFKDATVERIRMAGLRHDGNLAYGSRLTWRSRDQDWSGEAQRTIHFYRDSTAPTVVSVEITELSGSSFVLITFTEELHRARSPGIRHLLVKRTPTGGSEETVTQDRPPQLQGKDLTLELSETILSTDHVTVSYAKPGASHQRLQDKFGNEVAIFTDVARKRHEPSGQDFSHSPDTPGFVGVGTDSSGRLPDRSDHRGDTFNLVGLEPSRNYRVEVVFKSAGSTQRFFNERYFRWDNYPTSPTVGGDIWLAQCCYLDRLYAVSEWDSNYDGRAIFDFKTGRSESGNTRWVTIVPDNYMKPNVRFYGEYTVKLTDVTGLRQLVKNTSQRPVTVTYAKIGKNTDLHATDRTQLATSFVTGSNPDGYTLDRITAYISLTDGTDTGTGTPKVTILNNATSDRPGTNFCDLQSLADYETGLNLSNGDWPDELYSTGCASNTLDPRTTYWVVFSEDSSEAQTYFVGEANKEVQDPGSASGWSIGDTYYRKTGIRAWISAGLSPLAIGVYGTPK